MRANNICLNEAWELKLKSFEELNVGFILYNIVYYIFVAHVYGTCILIVQLITFSCLTGIDNIEKIREKWSNENLWFAKFTYGKFCYLFLYAFISRFMMENRPTADPDR